MIPRIVVIDSGVNSEIVECELIDILNKGAYDKCGHGTACAMVIKRICPEANIISMPLLNKEARASSEELESLLYYCLDLDCDVINLSLSVVDDNADKLDELCEKLREKRKIVVASVTNRKSESIPAVYKNVIGVRGKIFEVVDEYWFNPERKIQMIADMTPVFTNVLLKKFFIFSGNSKATAVTSALIANSVMAYGRISYEEILSLFASNASRTEWGELNMESQLSGLIGQNKSEKEEISTIRKIIRPIILKQFAIEGIPGDNDELFSTGIITGDTVNALLEEISRCFNINLSYLNITPRDIISVNNLSATIRRICHEKTN